MSRIYKKGGKETSGEIHEYTLKDIMRPLEEGKEAGKKEFVPDARSSGAVEFIPGGFDFDYEGGLRRGEILNRSIDEAREIVQKAENEADGIRGGARKEGYEQGYKEGYDDGMKKTLPVMDSVTSIAAELKRVRDEFYQNIEREMINLVVDISRSVIGKDIERDPSLVKSVIDKAIQQLKSREELSIKVNPEDLEEAERYRPELSREVEDIEKVEFRGDPHIARGGCMVESNIGSIDARLDTQLEAIRESLLNTLKETRGTGGQSRESDD